MLLLSAKKGETEGKIPLNYPVASTAHADGWLYLMERKVMGWDRNHQEIRLWPEKYVIYKVQL